MKAIIITGASSGLGRCLAERFAGQGDKVYAIARRKEKLFNVAEQYPGNIFAFPADISDAKQVKQTFAEIQRISQRIDVLINNAAVLNWNFFGTADFEIIDKTIDTNLKGTMYCTYSVLPGMMQRRHGYIINISSTAGMAGENWAPPPGKVRFGDYAASKSGLLGFEQFVGRDLRHYNILMTTLLPGRVDTEFWEKHENKLSGDKGALLQPEEVFEVINFIINRPPTVLYKHIVFFSKTEWH